MDVTTQVLTTFNVNQILTNSRTRKEAEQGGNSCAVSTTDDGRSSSSASSYSAPDGMHRNMVVSPNGGNSFGAMNAGGMLQRPPNVPHSRPNTSPGNPNASSPPGGGGPPVNGGPAGPSAGGGANVDGADVELVASDIAQPHHIAPRRARGVNWILTYPHAPIGV